MNYTCTHCNKPCHGDLVDFGLGYFEFWGEIRFDRNVQFVSECCEDDMIDEYGDPVELEEYIFDEE